MTLPLPQPAEEDLKVGNASVTGNASIIQRLAANSARGHRGGWLRTSRWMNRTENARAAYFGLIKIKMGAQSHPKTMCLNPLKQPVGRVLPLLPEGRPGFPIVECLGRKKGI